MNKKILIIEDDANILYALQAKFRVEGFDVEINSGDVSLEELMNDIRNYRPDYMVLDLILPKLDGFKVACKIQEDDETKGIKIFVFTNLTDNDSRQAGSKAGIDYYLLKTELGTDELVAKVKKIIQNKQKMQ